MNLRLMFALLVFPIGVAVSAQDKSDPGKISGLFFGDFYSVRGHNDASIKGKDGFWLRRLYLTYDKKLDAKMSARIQLEAKDPGDFSTVQNMQPFIKDAWVRYNENGHKITLGLIPTPTWSQAETRLGYRHIEKTALDLFRMGSARDKGISVEGPLDKTGTFDYSVMIGDGSGTRSSKGDTRAYYLRVGSKITEGLVADLYLDSWKRESGGRWSTVKGEVFYQANDIKAGLMAASQRRTAPAATAATIGVWSLYAEFASKAKNCPFIRFDTLNQALSDADKIEFYKMSKDGKPTLVMVGVRMKINEFLEIVPNITTISYRKAAGATTSPRQDSIFRITFSAKF